MNLCKTEHEYIEKIAPAVQRACKRYGYLPSVLIAQSCLENGYGIRDYFDNPQIELLLKHNNMVGIKSDLLNSSWNDKTVWTGESLTKETPEEEGGKKIIITDSFRKYDTIERSFADFLLFLKYASNNGKGGTPKYGDAVLSIKDPATLIEAVRSRGYATDSAYSKSVMRIVNKHNLTKYDDLSGVKPTEYVPGEKDMGINRKYITTNNTNSSNDPQYIVIHNTDNFNRGADALAHAKALYQGDIQGMSWHYVTDDHSVYQCVAHNRGAWHVGKNYGSHNLFGIVNNRNSIGIEMCVNAGYDYEQTFQNTVSLTKHLMKELNISVDRVLQHYDVCSKDCPSQIRKRGDWGRFKALIGGDDSLRRGDKGEAVRQMQEMLIVCGYPCGRTGADGDFGKNTENAVKSLQTTYSLTVDGIYNKATRDTLTALYGARKDRRVSAGATMVNSVKKITETARTQGWVYGDSRTAIPCNDKKISCDRLVSRALYDMGFTDQRKGGETCATLPEYLTAHGWTKVDIDNIKTGAVVGVRTKGKTYIDHVFVIASFNQGVCSKYDTGSQERINTVQPFKNVPLIEWSDKEFVCAWNPPAWYSSSKPGKWISGIDYSPVFNAVYYLKTHKNIKAKFGNDKRKAFDYFLETGMSEGDQAYAGFNPKAYKNRYADLRTAFGDDWEKYYTHYIQYGRKEGRIGT